MKKNQLTIIEQPAIPTEFEDGVLAIPGNPDGKIPPRVQSLFLQKFYEIRQARQSISKQEEQRRANVILEGIRREVGHAKAVAAVQKAEANLRAALDNLARTGFYENGHVICKGNRVDLASKMHSAIPEWEAADALELINSRRKTVEQVQQVAGTLDQLEIRLAMSTTYREVATILNAAVGYEFLKFTADAPKALSAG